MSEPESDVMTLTSGAVRALIEAKTVSPTRVSPLTNVLRHKAGAREAAPDLGSFRSCLDVLARPQAYVRVLIMQPNADEEIIGLLVRSGQGASFSLADDALHFGRLQPLDAFATSLAGSLAHPRAGGDVWLWPSVVQLVTGLWQETPDPSAPLSRASVIERLVTPEFSALEAHRFVEGAVGSGAVETVGDQLVVPEGLRSWFACVWSGHAVQIEYVPLPEDAPLEQAIEGPREHVLFIGPPGARLLNEVVTGGALERHLGRQKPREPSMLHLRALRAEDIVTRLRDLLQLQADAMGV